MSHPKASNQSKQVLEGELVRHQNKSARAFYVSGSHKLIWSGCLAPVLIIGLFIYLLIQGAQTDFGIDLIRGFIIFIVVFLLLQLTIGGGLLKKNPAGWRMTIFTNLGVILLLLMLVVAGLFSLISRLLS